MEVNAISTGATVPQAPSRAAQSTSGLAADMETFLTLLTTQLQNQDPTAPMDTNAFTEQLTQYAGIEQQIMTNDNLEALLALQGSDRQIRALDYVGSTIEAVGDTNMLGEEGGAEWIYAMADKAEKVTIQIRNQNNDIVYSEDRFNQAGRNDFIWDGNGFNGKRMPEGAYTMTLQTFGEEGETIPYTPGIRGQVSSIDFAGDTMYARIGDVQVNFDTMTNVQRPGSTNSNDSDSGSSDEGSETDDSAS